MKSVSVENPNTDIEERISTGQNEKLFLSVQDIVDMTGISTTAVYKLIRSNKLPSSKAPQNKKEAYRVRKEDLTKLCLET